MKNVLLKINFDLFGGIKETIITSITILAVVAGIIAIIKAKHLRPLVYTVFAVAWLFTGVFSISKYVSYKNTISYVIGTPEIFEPYKDFDFLEYNLKNVVWEPKEGSYIFEEIYQTSAKFEGEEKKYSVIVNNTPATYCNSANGRLIARYEKIFKDIDGEIDADITFNIQIVFKSSSITLKVTCNATVDNIGIVREYTNLNGLHIRIIKTVYSA